MLLRAKHQRELQKIIYKGTPILNEKSVFLKHY